MKAYITMMSPRKFRKLIRSPYAFFRDSWRNKHGLQRIVETTVPLWYDTETSGSLQQALEGEKPVFLYTPWIKLHGDALIQKIARPESYLIESACLFKNLEQSKTRFHIIRFARRNPAFYRRLLLRSLIPLRGKVKGFLFTLDWNPPMRILADVCAELGIPRILVPHEAAFIDRDKYYRDPVTGVACPVADVVLGWGDLQRDIFLERGYPAERYITTGAPKLDMYFDYQPMLDRQTFARVFSLSPEKKIVLFAMQPLDSQTDAAVARESQRQAITDLMDYVDKRGYQLIVRPPPSNHDVLSSDIHERIEGASNYMIDDSACYMVTPEEALYHCDAVVSINSTMLLEGALMGRPAVSAKYVEFNQIWQQAGIPAAHNTKELFATLDRLLAQGTFQFSDQGLAWVSNSLSCGVLDGQSATRMGDFLQGFAAGELAVAPQLDAVEKLLADSTAPLGLIGTYRGDDSTYDYLVPLLNAQGEISSITKKERSDKISGVDVFVETGQKNIAHRRRQRHLGAILGKKSIHISEGLLGSLSHEGACLSVLVDDLALFDTAREASRFETWLNSNIELSADEKTEAVRLMAEVLKYKALQAKDAPLGIENTARPKILLLDQLRDDLSVSRGLARADTFKEMLDDAVQAYPGHDILIKRAGDAQGNAAGYISDEILAAHPDAPIQLIERDVNILALVNVAERVFTVTAREGFDALMSGKPVHCYGVPFYSNWGLTIDKKELSRRARQRSLEEVFFFSYMKLSRYYHPGKQEKTTLGSLLDYLLACDGKVPALPVAETPPPPPVGFLATKMQAWKEKKGRELLSKAKDLQTQGRILLALKPARKATRWLPESYEAHYLLSRLYAALEQVDKALHYHQAAMRLNPETRAWQMAQDQQRGDASAENPVHLVEAHQLLSAHRMDIVVKYLYAKAFVTGVNVARYEGLYRRHIEKRTQGKEFPLLWNPDAVSQAHKTSVDSYVSAFKELITSIQEKGFDLGKWVPVSNENNIILDGAHRVAAAILFDKHIATREVPGHKGMRWHMGWFAANGFSTDEMDDLARCYAEIKGDDACLFILWGPAVQYRRKVEGILKKHVSIAADKEIRLTKETIPNFVYDIYACELGAQSSRRSNIQQKADMLSHHTPEAVAFLCGLGASKDRRAFETAKAAIREALDKQIPREQFMTVHTTDHAAHAQQLVHQLFNENHLRCLNARGTVAADESFLALLDAYRDVLQDRGIPVESTAIIGSAVLVALGLKSACDDIDFIMDTTMRREMDFSDRVVQLSDKVDLVREEYHQRSGRADALSDNEIIYDTQHSFYFRGLKFANIEIIADNKKNGTREKDRAHYQLMTAFLQERQHDALEDSNEAAPRRAGAGG